MSPQNLPSHGIPPNTEPASTDDDVAFVAFPGPPPASSGALSLPLEPATRERILTYLREHPSASAAELSSAWGLTPADIRYHLADLLASGLIEEVPRDPARRATRGRPARVYRLAAQLRPNNLAALCHALLETLTAGSGGDQREAIIRSVAERLAGEFQPSGQVTRRLNQAVEFLNHAQYRARWEAGAQGPRVLLRACPYAAVLAQHPEMCQVDQALLERLLQARLRMTARQDPATGKPPACIFLVS